MRNRVLDKLKGPNTPLNKCEGQYYVRKMLMSGIFNGFQQKVETIVSSTKFIHCNTDNVNLVTISNVNNF